jgi:5'-3' exoribonuclease 1
MGIKYFQKWIKTEYSCCVTEHLSSTTKIDTLAIDLNGIFHSTAQMILLNNRKLSSLLLSTGIKKKDGHFVSYLFENITKKINQLVLHIQPSKSLVLCIDGVTGLCKINQQRQRRYKSAFLNTEQEFDTNNFSPGTLIMDSLGKYIDKFIQHQCTYHPLWKHLTITFSNEKVPGEGEHKIFQIITSSCLPSSRVVIYGIDSDLVMLSLIAPSFLDIYIMKEMNLNEIEFIHISLLRSHIGKSMTPSYEFDSSSLILFDFVLLSFFIGNDFLPAFDVLSIYDGFYSNLFLCYRVFFQEHGTLCFFERTNELISFSYPKLRSFLSLFGNEKESIEKKYNHSLHTVFPDPIVLSNCSRSNDDDSICLHFSNYRKEYYKSKFPSSIDIPSIVLDYLRGMSWNLQYYTTHKVPDWLWIYPYSFSPLLTDLSSIFDDSLSLVPFPSNEPVDPMFHLLCILPPNSSSLLPKCLQNTHLSFPQYYPQFIHIDLTGKRKEWEGIVLLPQLSYPVLLQHYKKYKSKLSVQERKRNIVGINYVYS